MSHPGKSSLMWNIVDPDDPYDIRKSMIARLPQHSQNFMGNNLQIVCMMQAAEIERLSQYLDEFKIKYREVSRKELDRHSYQILIKQLTQKNQVLQGFKVENEKLKQFIKKQSLEMQQMLKNRSSNSSQFVQLQSKYDRLLNELHGCRQALVLAQNNQAKISGEYRQLRIRYDNLDKKRLSDLTAEREKYQLKIKERIQLEVRQVSHRFQQHIFQLQSDIKLYKQQIQSKNHEITLIMNKNEGFRKQLLLLQSKASSSSGLQNKQKQLQLINITLSQKTQQLQEIFSQYQKLEINYKNMQVYLSDLQRERDYYRGQIQSYNNSNDKSIQLENKVALLSSQVERLTFMIGEKNREHQELTKQVNQFDITLQHKENNYTRETYSLKERIRDLQLKLNLRDKSEQSYNNLVAQVERLNSIVRTKNEQIVTLQSKLKLSQSSSTQLMALRASSSDKDIIIRNLQTDKNKIEQEIHSIKSKHILQIQNINITITQLKKEKEELVVQYGGNTNSIREYEDKIRAYESSIPKMNQEIQRLNMLLRQKEENFNNVNKQAQRLRAQLQSVRKQSVNNNKVQIQIKRRVQVYEQKCLKLQQVNRSLLDNQSNIKNRVRQLQNKISYIQGQNQKLSDMIKYKEREIVEMGSKVQNKYSNSISQLNQNIIILRNENEKHKEDKSKLRTTLDTLQRSMIGKDKELALHKTQYTRQYQENKDRLIRDNERLKRQMEEYRINIHKLQQKNAQISRQVQQECMKIYGGQINQKQQIILALQRQLKQIMVNHKNTDDNLRNYKQRLLMVSSQIQRLTMLLTKKEQENEHLHHQLQIVRSKQSGAQELNGKVLMYSQQINQLNNDIHIHISTINNLKRDNQLLNQRVQGVGNMQRDNQLLNQKIQHIINENNANMEAKNRRIGELQRRLGQLQKKGEHEIQIINYKNIIKQLEEINQHTILERDQLFALSHQLQVKLNQKTNVPQVDESKIVMQVQQRLYLKHHQQMQELQSRYGIRIREYESMIRKLQQQLSQINRENNNQLKRQIAQKTAQYQQLNNIAHQYKEKVNSLLYLQSQIKQHRQRSNSQLTIIKKENTELLLKITNYEEQLKQTSGQIQRLNMVLRQKGNNEYGIDELRKQVQRLSHTLRLKDEQAQQWSSKYTKLYYTYQEVTSMHERLKLQYQNSKNKIKQYQHKIVQLQSEFQNLNGFLHSMKLQINALKQQNRMLKTDNSLEEKNRQLSMEIDRLTAINDNNKTQISDIRLRLSDQTSLHKRIQEYMALMVLLFAQIQTLRKRVQETQKQCEHVRRSSLTPYRVDRQSMQIGRRK